MIKHIEIPDEFRFTFQKLLRRIPIELRNDANLHEAILLYLKLGGEKLALACIEVTRARHKDMVKKMKKRLRLEAMQKAATKSLEEGKEEEGDADEDDEDEDDDDYSEDEDISPDDFFP